MIKTKRNQKWKLPRTILERRTLCSSSYKNHKLKVKLWWAGFLERKKRAFFVPFILSKGNFFNICVLSQCIVCSIHFQNVPTFTYQKTLLHTLICLFLKSSKAFLCLCGKSELKANRLNLMYLPWRRDVFRIQAESNR